ncbi:hypothetical protein DL98DRAFT_570956 [Cadophora sp. DSE1049]|nr:hypothetical protein DL98DRAFT_570956 [Cadophora sp. DSE1049]
MPPVFQPFGEARGSRSPLQPPPVQTDRPTLSPGDVCVGCIVWLPSKDGTRPSIRCINDDCCGKEELDDGGHNHPVVVLKIKQKKDSAVVGDLVTTFSDTPLSKYLSKRRHKEPSIPVYDPEATSLTTARGTALVQIKLEEGRLKKQSYVRLQHTYRVPVSMLRQYAYRKCRAYKRRLSDDSYNTLMGLLALSPEKYEPTKTLFETKNDRLLDLARSRLPHVVRAQRAQPPVLPGSVAPQPHPHRSYGTTHMNPPASHYIPPTYTYQVRNHIQPEYKSQNDGGEESSFPAKMVAGIIILGLVWWYWRTPSA